MDPSPPQSTSAVPAREPAAELVGLPPVLEDGVAPRSWPRLWFRVGLAVVVLAVLVVAGRRYYGELDRLKTAPLWVILAMSALYVAGRLPPADLLRAALASLGHRVGRVETFFVLMVQYYINMLVPRAGIGAPAGYMKLRHGVPISDLGAAQVVTLTLTQFVVLGTAALVVQGSLAAAGIARWDPILAAVFAGVALFSALPLCMRLPGSDAVPGADARGGILTRFLGRLAFACRRLGRDRRLLVRAFAGHAVVLLLRTARVQLSFRAVGVHVGFWQAFVASAAADVMFLVSITPGALGFREGALVYLAPMLGTTREIALAAGVLDRLVLTGCNVVLGQIGLWRYIGKATHRPRSESAVAAAAANATTRFSARVDAYVKYRPGYPAGAIDPLLRETGLRPGSVVADIGSGTGISAEPFLRAGMTVFCVEPNADMRAAAERLLGGYAGFRSATGTAEATGLPDASVDLILCAQAFHWFDRDRARREFSRIGTAGAHVAVVFNARKKRGSTFLEEYDALLLRYGTDYRRVDHDAITEDEVRAFLGPAMRRATFPNEQRFDLAGLRGRVASSSYTPLPGQAGHAELFSGMDELFARTATDGHVTFEYLTEVYWAPIQRSECAPGTVTR